LIIKNDILHIQTKMNKTSDAERTKTLKSQPQFNLTHAQRRIFQDVMTSNMPNTTRGETVNILIKPDTSYIDDRSIVEIYYAYK
jgi:hypothetical protein